MNVLEKAEKALEYLKITEGLAKNHDLQTATATLGRCLGALGYRPNCARHYANLLQSAVPTLLLLASNDSAEVRLVGDEALNRAVVGGNAFHAYKVNTILQNQIDHTKNARWIRAALTRICLGECWLRPGVGKIRAQAQTLFPKLSHIVRQTKETQLIMEALESNLPRILNALAEYSSDEELFDLAKALFHHVDSIDPPVRRNAATCIAHLCSHRESLLGPILINVFENLWPFSLQCDSVLGWFGVIKAVFQVSELSRFTESDLFTLQDYIELYHLCIHYLEQIAIDHNTQNAVMECLTVLLSQATGDFKRALLERHPKAVNLDHRQKCRTHMRNVSSVSAITSIISNMSASFTEDPSSQDPEITFRGALHLGSLSQLQTPRLSVEDLSIQTPDSPASESEVQLGADNADLTRRLSEKLEEMQFAHVKDEEHHMESNHMENLLSINIGSPSDDDIPLKYCSRLLTYKFLLTGNKGCVISDRSVRVSVKASALTCLSEILQHYPQAMTVYLDKDVDDKCHNVSGSSEGTDSNQEINDFILERNVCYQDSLTESLTHDVLNQSLESTSQLISKKDSKSESVEQKSSKDAPSNILDGKMCHKNELMTSALTDSTNPNLSNSNFTSTSNMTVSNDRLSTGYPMSSSGDILFSSLDLDMKLDHFGESTTNLDIVEANYVREKDNLRSTHEVCTKDPPAESVRSDEPTEKCVEEVLVFEQQHMSDLFALYAVHGDPHIRGLLRLCIGNYVSAALDLSHGDYHRWKNYSLLPKEVNVNINTDRLVDVLLKGLSDEIHSCVNHTLTALCKVFAALANSSHWRLLPAILNSLSMVEKNPYWLCKANLCKFYEKVPYQRFFMLYPNAVNRGFLIMNTMYRLLSDQDLKVRNAAATAITTILPKVYSDRKKNPIASITEITKEHSENFKFDYKKLSLDLVRYSYFYFDLPEDLCGGESVKSSDNLKKIVGDLVEKLMDSSCKYLSQGVLLTLHSVCKTHKPWSNVEAYSDQGIMELCLDRLDCCNGSVSSRALLLDLCTMIYPVEIHKVMNRRTSKQNIFERDTQVKGRWQHLDDEKCSSLAEKFLQVTLKMLNILVHLIEEVNPTVHIKSGIALPGSPVRRKTQDSLPRKSSSDSIDDKSLRRKPVIVGSMRPNFVGHFFNEPFYMYLYENLRATYSNHKINLDPKSSIFYDFLSKVLDALAIQLELATETELGCVTEELLYYMKIIMPHRADKTVFCITQLLKCLFSTNMISQYWDFESIRDEVPGGGAKTCFFADVLSINALKRAEGDTTESQRSSVSSNVSQRLSVDTKNPSLVNERQFLIKMENFNRSKMDRKWTTNKRELERYIRLFEPVVIQALKSYTMQNDIPLQCKVLCLLNQLLTLRVNYCMLDSDQIFIGFLLKQLDLVEQHEIPNCCELVHSILMFLVHLSSSKHHTKQIIEIPKLIQLCDGLMASGAHAQCVAALRPTAVRVFWAGAGGAGAGAPGRARAQEAQATREVLFYMMQKTMNDPKVLELVSCILCLSQDHPESYYRWSELASDTLLNLLSQRSIDLESREAICILEKLLDSIYKDVLLEQSRVEILLKILFKAPPDQMTTPYKSKLQYLSIIMVLLRKVLVHIPENEVLLSINDLKASSIAPQSIFFNIKTDVDPLNVQSVNENCANLSPDVIFVRFLFRTLTYAIMEVDKCNENVCTNLEAANGTEGQSLMYSVCVNLICHVKEILHLTNGCLYPLTAKTSQIILHNEQSGLNTGLYSPEENIPLDLLNLICLRSAQRIPLLTVHWSHLLIRLKFLEQKYWQKLLGYVRNLPLSSENMDKGMLQVNMLQVGCFMAYCEYFVENGLSEAVHLTWLLVNRVHIVVSYYHEPLVRSLVEKVQENASSSGLLLQAVAARCQSCLKDEFALNTLKMLSNCHESQSGALVFLICRIIGKLEPAIAVRYANLAIERCVTLKYMSIDKISVQLSKEDVQVALELLQRDKVHVRYSALVIELNALASSVFDLSPLDLSQDRKIKPQYIVTTKVDDAWLVNQVKSRCCQPTCSLLNGIEKHTELAHLLSNLSSEGISTVLACQDFDRRLLHSCFRVTTDAYLKGFLSIINDYEGREMEETRLHLAQLQEETPSDVTSMFRRSESRESKSQFFIPMSENRDAEDQAPGTEAPCVPPLYAASMTSFERSMADVIRLFPKQSRPLSQSENFNLNIEQTIDRYTRRCHQVFQDKLFYHEFCIIQHVMSGYLESLHRIIAFTDELDCSVSAETLERVLPATLARNIGVFIVISLQYISFLIKNKKTVESPVHSDVSFRVTAIVTEKIVVDNVIGLALDNASKALSFKEIWSVLNVQSNVNRVQSAISCLYAVTKYFLKDTKPLILKNYIQTKEMEDAHIGDVVLVCDKLLTLIEYWQENFYNRENAAELNILSECYRRPVESILVNLARLDLVCNVALIPPIAWPSVEFTVKKDMQKVNLPLQALQDMDALEAFLFRVNFIGWSSKKLFEEIWVALLGALQGNGTHWAVRGIMQLLISTIPKVRSDAGGTVMMHLPRRLAEFSNGVQRMRGIVAGTSIYEKIFTNVNLERVPYMNSENCCGYHYAQFNTEYLKLASDISDDASFRVKICLKRMRRSADIDVNSCLQLLMDVASQMLQPKSPSGPAARCALLGCIISVSDLFSEAGQWCWLAQQLIALTAPDHKPLMQYSVASQNLLYGLSKCLSILDGFDGLAELSTVHQKLLKSLSSSYAPLRHAALQGCLLQLGRAAGRGARGAGPGARGAGPGARGAGPDPYGDLVAKLRDALAQYLDTGHRISLYEQSLYWTVLFTLVQIGHSELMHLAVDFLLAHPTHFCSDLIVKGITSMIRLQVLPKDLKKTIIEKLLENTKNYSEEHAMQILIVHLFTTDDEPPRPAGGAAPDPDALVRCVERAALAYAALRRARPAPAAALRRLLRDALPPAAALRRALLEFLDACAAAEARGGGGAGRLGRRAVFNAEIVFEVFQAAVAQDQLQVLSGWIFEALPHLLAGKISAKLLPYCLLCLLVSAGSDVHLRSLAPLTFYILRIGLQRNEFSDMAPLFSRYLISGVPKMRFTDRRLLCIVCLHSNFSTSQMEKLRELCSDHELDDLLACLAVKGDEATSSDADEQCPGEIN